MRKIFIKEIFFLPALILTLFVTMNKVNADTIASDINYYSNYEFYSTFSTSYSEQLDYLKNYYNDNFSSTYDYYFIYGSYVSTDNFSITLIPTDTTSIEALNYGTDTNPIWNISSKTNLPYVRYTHYKDSNPADSYGSGQYATLGTDLLYYASAPITFNSGSSCVNNNYSCFDKVVLPTYSNSDLDVSFASITLTNGSIVPTYDTLNNSSIAFTEINLNNYNSVILSLKDYTSRNSFNTTILTLGQLCLTPVYDYGMKNKGDYYAGYEVQGCTPQYSEFTPVSISILSSDINNHAIYYIKPYNTSIENKIKVDTSIFDITYVTSENANNPTVTIGGRSYPVIPYSDLTSSATTSTENGYIPGASCQLGDLNCQASVSGMDISDIFTHPLDLLKNMWSAITSVFSVITAFILLLPTPLQTFLYVAFMFAVILGILKLILGG